jgi:hypothetical protein
LYLPNRSVPHNRARKAVADPLSCLKRRGYPQFWRFRFDPLARKDRLILNTVLRLHSGQNRYGDSIDESASRAAFLAVCRSAGVSLCRQRHNTADLATGRP